MRVFSVALVVFLFAPLSTLSAQEPPTIGPGTRVRVTAPDCGLHRQATTFRESRSNTLVLDTMECPLASVTHLDVSRGRRGHPWRGAGVGLLAGAAIGAAWGYADAEANGCGEWDTSACVVAGAGVIGVAGALLGGVVGVLIRTDRWEEIPLDRLQVSFAPQRDEFVFAFTVRF